MKTGMTLLALAAVAATTSLSAQEALLYTTLKGREQCAALKMPSLRNIDAEDVVSVVPHPTASFSARKFAPHDALTTVIGDEDNDGVFWESVLNRNTDALLWRKGSAGRSLRDLYFSPSDTLGARVNTKTGGIGTSAVATPGDVLRIEIDSAGADGQFVFFLRETQIRDAFKINAKQNINVDAITADWQRSMIYLSLEDDHTVTVNNSGGPFTLVANDGAVLGLRVTAWSEPVTLSSTSGLMVLTETQVNAAVAASAIRNNLGAPVLTIGDLDGLELVGAGSFRNRWGTFRHLMFAGENLTGGGIVRTGGAIPAINGVAMGNSAVATTGAQVGLRPSGVSSLNGLQRRLRRQLGLFVLETPTPLRSGAGNIQVDIEGATGPGVAVLMLNLATLPIHHMNANAAPISTDFFPETIWPAPLFLPVALNAQGQGSWSLAVPASNQKVIFQAAQFLGGQFHMSTPLTIDLSK